MTYFWVVMSPATVNPSLALAIVVGLGLLGGIGLGIKALLDRKGLQATARATNSKAEAETATAASILTAAARELIDPLRQELAQERAEHADEIDEEHKRVASLRRDTEAAQHDVRVLRAALRRALEEVERHKRRVLELERELTSAERELAVLRGQSGGSPSGG